MQQHFIQGQRLRQRYMTETGLLNPKYSRYETTIRSADTPRCIQSALANFAAFYSNSPTYPLDTNGWPSAWTPIPVHSMPKNEDRELEPGVSCPRATQLANSRENQPAFQNFLASNWQLFATINTNAGRIYEANMQTLFELIGSLSVERDDFNLTMPSWVTDQFYYSLKSAVEYGEDYTAGAAGFGLPEDTDLLKLRGGFMLKAFVDNIKDVIGNLTTTKYYVFSGHDTIERQLLYCLGVKNSVIGMGIPYYASMIANELWMKDGQYFVKFLFSANADSELKDFTSLIPPCKSDVCPLNAFLQYVQKYLPADASKECAIH
ncbi:hypothetical protein PENTCL1PPCAC_30609 [Pristionchus entomophagus]|uniref:Phosphatase n=2 Tax=Pristionchus entomophagus TaxID=358040 RepID=A0AAV5UMR8_9BILA|nr:hypothetical protein PENTCL1PPCAC_30609 [Pristionchus entomophagus]